MGQISQSFDHIKHIQEINELSVVLYSDSFFCGYWSAEDELLKTESVSLESFSEKLTSWNKDFPDSNIKLMSTRIPFVHLAQGHYDQDYFEDYFKGLYDLRKRKRHEKELDNFVQEEVHTLHYLHEKIVDGLNKNSMPFKLSHISTAMSNYAALTDCNVLVYMEGQNLHILCHKDSKFRFYNQFYCVDVNDYLYFIMMLVQNFQIDYHGSEIHMGGEIDRTSRLYTTLKSYFPKLKVIDDQVKFTEVVSNPGQLYFDLFLCKSCV